MTTQEMIDEIGVLRDLFKAPYYDTDEYIVFINNAIDTFVSSIIPDGKRFNPDSQKKIDQIRTLITTFRTTSFTANVSNEVDAAVAKISVPGDFYYYYSASAAIDGKKRTVEIQDFNSLTNIDKDPFAKEKILLLQVGSFLYIIADKAPDYLNLVYVKRPAKVALAGPHCDLPENVHRRICMMAVSLTAPGSDMGEFYKMMENEIYKK